MNIPGADSPIAYSPIAPVAADIDEGNGINSQINHLSYILKGMSTNAMEKFESLNALPSNALSINDKQFIADRLSRAFGFHGLTVNIEV